MSAVTLGFARPAESAPEILVDVAGIEELRSPAITPDERFVVAFGLGGRLEVRELKSGRLLRAISTGAAEPSSFDETPLIILPDSRTVLVLASDTVSAVDIEDGSTRRLEGWDVAGVPYAITLSLDGSTLAALAGDGAILIGDPYGRSEPRLLREAKPDDPRWEILAISPERTILAVLDNDEIELLDAASGTTMHEIAGPADYLTEAKFTEDGTQLVALNSGGGKAYFWSVADGTRVRTFESGTNDMYITGLRISPDGRYLAAVDGINGHHLLWETASGETVDLPQAANSALRGGRLLFSADGKRLFQYSGRLAELSDTHTGELLFSLDVPSTILPELRALAASPDGKLVAFAPVDPDALAGPGSNVLLWSTEDGRQTLLRPPFWYGETPKRMDFPRWSPFAGLQEAIAFSQDGAAVAVLYDERVVIVFDTAAESVKRIINIDEGDAGGAATFEANGISLSADARHVVAWNDSSVRIYSTRTGTLAHILDSFGEVKKVVPSPTAATAVVVGSAGAAIVDLQSGTAGPWLGTEVWPNTDEYSDDIKDARFTNDGSRLVLTGDWNYGRQGFVVVDPATGAMLQSFRAPARSSEEADSTLCWGVDSQQGILVAGRGGPVLLEFASGLPRLLAASAGDVGPQACVVSQDARRIVSYEADRSVALRSARDFSPWVRLFAGRGGGYLVLLHDGAIFGDGGAVASVGAAEGLTPIDSLVLPTSSMAAERIAQLLAGASARVHAEATTSESFLGQPVQAKPSAISPSQGQLQIVANQAHAYSANAVAVTPDGLLIATASSDKLAKLWDATTGQLVRSFAGATSGLKSVAVAPDGSLVAAGDDSGYLHIWEAASGLILQSLKAHDGAINALSWSADGRHLASGMHHFKGTDDPPAGATLTIWDTESWKVARVYEGTPAIVGVAFLADGAHLAVLTEKGVVIWDVVRGLTRRSFVIEASYDNRLTASRDGRTLAVISHSSVTLVDVERGILRDTAVTPGYLLGAAFSVDGARIYAGSRDGTLLSWEVRTGRRLDRIELPDGRSDVLVAVAMPDGNSLLTVSTNGGPAILRSTETGEALKLIGKHVDAVGTVAFTPNGDRIVAGGGSTVSVWDVRTGAKLRHYDPGEDFVAEAHLSRDGSRLLLGYPLRLLRTLDLQSGLPIAEFRDAKRELTESEKSDPIMQSVMSLQVDIDSRSYGFDISPDGRQAAFGRNDGTVKIVDLESGKLERSMAAHENFVSFITYDPEGRRFVSGGADQIVRLWNASTGELVREFKGHRWAVRSAAFNADGSRLLTGSGDRTLILWDVATGQPLSVLEGDTHVVRSVAFFPDGKRAVSGSYDGKVRLWDLDQGRLTHTLEGHVSDVNSVAVSPDGLRIASASVDGTVRLWSAGTGASLATLITSASGEWVSLSGAGFVNASAEGADLLGVVDGLNVYSVKQFYQTLYKPHLVEALLDGDPEGRHADEASRLDLRKTLQSGPPPAIEWSKHGATRTDDRLKVTVTISNRGGGIGRVEWRVNGLTLGVERGAGPIAEDHFEIDREIRLLPGRNHIEVLAYNAAQLISSEPLELVVDRAGITAGGRGTLHVLVAGVNDYSEPRFRLNYARQDALAVADMLTAAGESLFDAVDVIPVLDAQVTRDGLDAAFAAISEKAQPEDTFVFFLAGHGKTIANRYYFIPQDFQPGEGRTYETHWIGQELWQEWFARIPARKSILIYDTCESETMAAAARGADERSVALELLRHATGRSVISAARAAQAAFEGYRGHGLLTYVLLEAFAHGDTNANGFVETDELGRYAHERVPQLSVAHYSVRQQPKTLISDPFPIGLARTEPTPVEASVIPRQPTHVVIRQIALAATRGDGIAATLQPGTLVRLISENKGQARIARDGLDLGEVPSDALARLQ